MAAGGRRRYPSGEVGFDKDQRFWLGIRRRPGGRRSRNPDDAQPDRQGAHDMEDRMAPRDPAPAHRRETPFAAEALLAAAALSDALPLCDFTRLLDWTDAMEAAPCRS
jgi:hypothetical protein